MKKRMISVFFLLFFHFNINAQVNVADSLALVDFYNSTNGESWNNKKNWLNGKVNEWFGVTVTNNRVTGLSLVNNLVDGVLPNSFGNLTAINAIYLSNNKIKGTIPASIGNLSALSFFYLNNNQLEGNLPNELGNATSLREIHIEHNKLSGNIPVSLRYLATVIELVLSHNQLSGNIPGELGDLRVQRLELNNNQLSGEIPERLKIIRNLNILKLNNNQLSGEIPAGLLPIICFMVDLSSNQLSGNIPSDLGNNTTMAHVNLSNNQLTGEIPPTIGNMSGLQTLELNNNQLSGNIPSSFDKLNRLSSLNLMNNQLSSTLPDGLCSLPNLDFLELSNNQFTFDGLECIGSKQRSSPFANYAYDNQKTLQLNFADLKISLSAGGSLPNNTYYFYKDDELLNTVKGDSSLTVSESGKYRVEVTNDKIDRLTLHSYTIEVNISTILPLQWIEFTAKDCSNKVCLQWQTENEQNTSYFEIERSTNGSIFDRVGTQTSYNNPDKHTYRFTDYTPVNGLNFYRIKQVDIDGVYTYSNTVNVKISSENTITITPNPADNFVMLSGISKAEKILIYNVEGKLMNQWSNINGNQRLNIANLRNGIYIIKIFADKKENNYKLIKQ
ncbi:MAG: T9SS type A sorting domain-containing protein [Chitinophagaceae bacterium]|nr:T9SS type A sorting domain-containing protein [Chitinophagaceae bacterium]